MIPELRGAETQYFLLTFNDSAAPVAQLSLALLGDVPQSDVPFVASVFLQNLADGIVNLQILRAENRGRRDTTAHHKSQTRTSGDVLIHVKERPPSLSPAKVTATSLTALGEL